MSSPKKPAKKISLKRQIPFSIYDLPPIPPEELERRRLGAERLKGRLASTVYAEKAARAEAAKPGGAQRFWENFYASRINS